MAKHRIAVEHMNTYSTERQWSTMQLFFLMRKSSMNWHGVISQTFCKVKKKKSKVQRSFTVFYLLFKKKEIMRKTHISAYLKRKKNREDKPENNEAGYPWGWKRFGNEGQFCEYIFMCSVDFWNHMTTLCIQEIKLNH